MANKIIKAQMKQRRDTKANWAAQNPVLLAGELGIVSDDPNLYKVGDGTTAWNALPFRGFNGTVVNETGTSETAVMSQKGVSQSLLQLGGFFITPGKYINTKGELIATPNQNVITDYLDVSLVSAITIKGRSSSLVALIAFYDENKTCLSTIYGNDKANVLITIPREEFPTNTKYIIANGYGDERDVLSGITIAQLSTQASHNTAEIAGVTGLAFCDIAELNKLVKKAYIPELNYRDVTHCYLLIGQEYNGKFYNEFTLYTAETNASLAEGFATLDEALYAWNDHGIISGNRYVQNFRSPVTKAARIPRTTVRLNNALNTPEITTLESSINQTQTTLKTIQGKFKTTPGKYINTDGYRIDTPNQNVITDYLDVSLVSAITIKGRSSSLVALIAFYDENKTCLSTIYGDDKANVLITIPREEFPTNTKYIIANGYGDERDVLQLADMASLYELLTRSNTAPTQDALGVGSMGASLMFNGNSWFDGGCAKANCNAYNKAESGVGTPVYFANKLWRNTYCTAEEFENIDILAIQFASSGNVYIEGDTPSADEYEAQLEQSADNPFNALTHAQCLDYILKKWQNKCYAEKDNPDSKWYGTQHGKPCRFIFVTHWHDGRVAYNESIRKAAQKWGAILCEFDTYIGFSKNSTLEGTQVSTLYSVDTEIIDGVTFGWHPLRGAEGSYIQGRMASIFANTLRTL